ncbi:response regulator [Trichlorobacter lovleyi]|uniref:response regulator n=1 Tax=Trichlorobacter lovleyi TaxID=313985 RepID=UPI002240D5D5|nr:response regulator [Trichlorobacter lovleyi]QOX79428.1 response regulator [Trichlorobacter lovleyi]
MKKRILLVDDEAGVTRMMRRNLEATGRFEVRDLNDPTQALETARQFRPDLVLLDVMMPEMDGGSVAAAFAEEPQLARVPIIFLTAIVSKKEVEPTGSQIGSHTFLAKPVAFNDLLACIDGQLG